MPAGTKACLLDWTDFKVAGITAPADSDYKVGDPVVFKAQGSAKLDTAFTAGTTYYVITSTPGALGAGPTLTVSATKGGVAVPPKGDGGTGTVDSADTATNHVLMTFAEHQAVCQVQSWSMNLSREEVDTTALQCGPGAGGGRNAPFRTKQAGFVDGTGTMSVRFTRDKASLARRLLQNSLRKNQDGASVQLFVDTIYDSTGKTNLAESLYLEGAISILGFDLNVSVGSEPTQATVNFSFSQQPSNIFGDI